ncbi:hypothetical protein CDL15_Pgr025621 [Punica granatum]|uniref:Uncharacterized protein n=1 Tax=Punica granatum TaxID=22663 RepID=A0A218WCG1_PUNGR|nr:hypothetical protein CDL15_Pgr025621 [Punica granatum]PKI37228.1 hypothetical protein CRG98_042380 [Punica granatum]
MEFLDPIKAAMEITRRHSAYERDWETRHLELSQSAKSGGTQIQLRCSAFKDGKAWLGIVCTNSFGSMISAWSFDSAITASPMQGELDGFIKAAEITRDMNIQQFHSQAMPRT